LHLPGRLVCDDCSGYKVGFGNGVTEIGCMTHAPHKFYDLHQTYQSELEVHALEYIGQLYQVEREIKDLSLDKRQLIRNEKPGPLPMLYTNECWLTGKKCRVA
jgi:hypothetical protein